MGRIHRSVRVRRPRCRAGKENFPVWQAEQLQKQAEEASRAMRKQSEEAARQMQRQSVEAQKAMEKMREEAPKGGAY